MNTTTHTYSGHLTITLPADHVPEPTITSMHAGTQVTHHWLESNPHSTAPAKPKAKTRK